MDKFSTLASPNCYNFVFGSKCLMCSEMGTMDSIIALKDHFTFKFVHGSRFPSNQKTKCLFSRCS